MRDGYGNSRRSTPTPSFRRRPESRVPAPTTHSIPNLTTKNACSTLNTSLTSLRSPRPIAHIQTRQTQQRLEKSCRAILKPSHILKTSHALLRRKPRPRLGSQANSSLECLETPAYPYITACHSERSEESNMSCHPNSGRSSYQTPLEGVSKVFLGISKGDFCPFALSLSKGRGAVHGSTSSPRTCFTNSGNTLLENKVPSFLIPLCLFQYANRRGFVTVSTSKRKGII